MGILDTAGITLMTSHPRMRLEDSEYDEGKVWSKVWTSKLPWRNSVSLASKEVFEKMEGVVGLLVDAGPVQEGFEKGFLTYLKAFDDDFVGRPSEYRLVLRLSLEEFAQVSALPLPLVEVHADVEGLEYDWQPDGSGVKWDNKERATLAVKSFSLRFGREPEPEDDDVPTVFDDDTSEPSPLPDILTELAKVNQNLSYVILALIFVMAATAIGAMR